MDRTEAVERIAAGELRWGRQRDMFVRDKRGRELSRDEALQVFRDWANDLPESTFRYYARHHAPAYLSDD
jgi:hypothetical protein